MKRFLLTLLCILGLLSIYTYAAEDICVKIDGIDVEFTDACPTIIDGRTMVPVRSVCNALGAEVDYDSTTGIITGKKENTTLVMGLGSKNICVNDTTDTMDVVPAVINGRALVPARYIAEGFGYDVGWDNDSRTVVITSLGYNTRSRNNVELHFIDVGQGDCTLVSDNGHYMLIDAGENEYGPIVVNYLYNMGITTLDYVIATHPHSDHIGGLDTVINSFNVNNVIMTRAESASITFSDFLTAVEQSGANVIEAKVGNSYNLGLSSFVILAPFAISKEMNNNSVAIKLTCGGNSAILCGDAGSEEESLIVQSGIDISADVLKINHHGSASSSTDEFINKVNPSIAVICVGKDNKYGHPTSVVLSKLSNKGISIYRTDLNGNIIVSLTDTVNVRTSKSETDISLVKTVENIILNVNNKKAHLSSCSSVSKMSDKNKQTFTGSVQDLIDMGYSACSICQPF